MKRAAILLALAAFVTAPATAQWLGMPVWNSPKGGTGITINGDWGKPDETGGKGNAFGGRASAPSSSSVSPAPDGVKKPALKPKSNP